MYSASVFYSSTKSFDQKSQVPSPSHPFTGSLISSHLKHSLLPHMYVLIIGVSIAGAFLFSLIFVALYYYLNINPALQGSSTGKRDTQCADKKKKNEEQDDHTGPKLFPHTIESDTEVDLDSLKSFERWDKLETRSKWPTWPEDTNDTNQSCITLSALFCAYGLLNTLSRRLSNYRHQNDSEYSKERFWIINLWARYHKHSMILSRAYISNWDIANLLAVFSLLISDEFTVNIFYLLCK